MDTPPPPKFDPNMKVNGVHPTPLSPLASDLESMRESALHAAKMLNERLREGKWEEAERWAASAISFSTSIRRALDQARHRDAR